MAIKRYLLFAGYDYEGGGWTDFRAAFDSAEQAEAFGKAMDRLSRDWWEVVDLESLEVTAEGRRS